MADSKLSALTALTGANVDPAADLLYIDDVSVTTSKKILVQELWNSATTLTALTGANTDTSADSIVLYDNSATSEKKQTVAELNNALNGIGIPQNSQSGAYTTVLADAGKHLLHPSADTTARTFTIAANASVAYPVGTVITFVNQDSAGVMTIAINSDTMRLAGPGTTGSRTLAANGMATALKLTSTEWIINGTGLT